MGIVSLNIIRGSQNDAQLIADLSTNTFIETYSGTCSDADLQEFLDKCFSKEVIFNELKDPEEFYFIAFADGYPVGYMRMKEDYSEYPKIIRYKALEIKRIYVLNKYQSQRIGSMLMQCAINIALDMNFEALWLGVWEENLKAIRFYEREGFIDTGAWYTFYIGKTAQIDHWMIKIIRKKSG